MVLLRVGSLLLAVAYLLAFALPTFAYLTPKIVHEFPFGTWVENLAVRSSNPPTILATILTSPYIYVVDPKSKFEPVQLAYFPDYDGVLGIAELRKDVFYVVTGRLSLQTLAPSPGTSAVWKVDLRGVPADVGTARPKLKEIAKFPAAGLLNGLTVLNPRTLLISDSLNGLVWSLNVHTGKTAVAINDTSFDPIVTSPRPFGINGIHVIGKELYYTNSNFQTFNRIPIDIHTGRATGPAFALAQSTNITPDDFTVDFEGNVWLASNALNQLDFLKEAALPGTTQTTIKVVAGEADSTTIAGWTSVAFGISKKDVKRGRLYIATTGGVPQYVGRNWTTGGTISRVDVGSLQ